MRCTCWNFWVDRIFASREALGGSFIHPYARRADHVHGSNGIGYIELPHPETRTTEEHDRDLLIRMAKENHAKITLCSGGPVTNLALALVKAIDCKAIPQDNHHGVDDLLPGIYGPPPPMVDKTFASDLEATQIVFRSGADITLMDVTMTTLFSSEKMDDVAREGDQAARR